MDNFREYVGMIANEVETFMNNDAEFKIYQMDDINEWGSFHAMKTMAEITILTASRTLQGSEVRDSLDKSFADLYTDLDGGFKPVNMLFPNMPSGANRKRDKAQKSMSDFYVDIIRKRANGNFDVSSSISPSSSFANYSQHDHDMIAALMHQRYKNGRELTEREVAHIMIALLMAGQHTSSATLAWASLRLADNPDIT